MSKKLCTILGILFALSVSAQNRLPQLIVDDLQLDGSTLSTITTDKDLTLSPNGTGTVLNTDPNLTLNSGGDDAASEEAGLVIDRAGTSGAIVYEDALTSKFKAGALGSEIELVNISGAQTLTNKTMAAASNSISGLTHGSEVDDLTTGVHGVAGTLVGTSDSQTLTNKTIDADNNTVSNLAHGAEVDDLSSGIHGVVGDVLGTTDVQVITLKDIDGGTASNTSRLTIPKDTLANLQGLTDKEGTLAYDTTNNEIVFNNGSTFASIDTVGVGSDTPFNVNNAGITNSVASSALTIDLTQSDGASDPTALLPVTVAFRSATITSGAYLMRTVAAALTIVVPDGATLNHLDATDGFVYTYLLDNSGTIEFAVSSIKHDEGSLQSTTILDTSSDGTALYSATARANVPIRLIARSVSNQTTAGTWDAVLIEVSPNGITDTANKMSAGISNVVTRVCRVDGAATPLKAGDTTLCAWITSLSSAATGRVAFTFTGAFSAEPVCEILSGAVSATSGRFSSIVFIASTSLDVITEDAAGTDSFGVLLLSCTGRE